MTMHGSPNAWSSAAKGWETDVQKVAFAVVPVAGKGVGCVATRDIHVGERLLAERPLIAIEHSTVARCRGWSGPLEAALCALTSAERQTFFALSQNSLRFGTEKSMEGVFRTNSMPFRRASDQPVSGIFATAARLNHSCDPCATYKYNHALGMMTVHAIKNIASGTELTVSYGFEGSLLRNDRQRRLRDSFGFECTCSKCSLSGAALQESERRMARLGQPLRVGSLAQIAGADVTAVLSRLDEVYQLALDECSGDAAFDGVEVMFVGFLELCETVARKLREVVTAWLPSPPLSAVPRAGQAAMEQTMSITKVQGGELTGQLRLSLEEARAKAAAFTAAARKWASRAQAVAQVTCGNDSPTYQAWTLLLRSYCEDAATSHECDALGLLAQAGLTSVSTNPSARLAARWIVEAPSAASKGTVVLHDSCVKLPLTCPLFLPDAYNRI